LIISSSYFPFFQFLIFITPAKIVILIRVDGQQPQVLTKKMSIGKAYELFNRFLIGILAMDCLNGNCRIISIPLYGQEPTLLELIVITRLVVFNLLFWKLITDMRGNRVARIKKPETVITRANIWADIHSKQIEERIFSVWLTVLEFMVFTFANFVPSARITFVVLGLAIGVYREIDPI